MKIDIQSLHFTPRQELRDYVTEKVSKLSHLNDQLLAGEVCLRLNKAGNTENKICEVKLIAPGKDLFAKRQCKTFEEATSQVVNALETQLKKRKTKLQDR